MKPEQLLSRAASEAKRFVKKVVNTPVGRGVIAGGLASTVGMAADNQANYQPDLNPQQAGHTLVLDNLHLQAAQQIDYSQSVDFPQTQVQVETGDFEVINKGGVELTRIYGPNDPDNRLFVQVFLQKAANKELAKKVVNQFFMVDPMPKYLDKFTFWVRTSPTPDFGCDRSSKCVNKQAIVDEIKRTHNVIGIYSPETIILINNGSLTGASFLDGYNLPNINSYAGISMTEEAGGNANQIPVIELAHSIFNLSDLWIYGSDLNIGIGFPNCSRTPQLWGWDPDPTSEIGCGWDKEAYKSDLESILGDRGKYPNFGTWERTWIDRLVKLFPGNYAYPPFKLSLYRNNPVSGKGFPQGSLDLGFKADIPYGTKNMVYELIPAADKETSIPNSPGLGPIQITDTRVINQIRNEGLILPAPKLGEGPYVALPGMSYIWRVKVSPEPTLPFQEGPGWQTLDATPVLKIPNQGRGEIKDYSAPRGSEKISFLLDGKTTNNLAPFLQWQDGNSDVFYYHLQVSADPTFEKDPAKATAAVWENLIHGGESIPLNSWKVPGGLLQPGKTYYMKIKPRVQGDGEDPQWSSIRSFRTSADAKVLAENELEVITQPTAKRIITKEEHLKLQEEIRQAEQERMRSTREHWDGVEREVYRKEEEQLSPAS